MTDRRYAGVEDLVLISDVSEKGIVQNLEKRFSADEIYTYLGNVLIVCNPFRWLQLYNNSYIQKFNNGQLSELEPHVYAVSESAFKDMLLEEMNQCVIISGESGAGKTEAAKQIMNYIAAVSGSGGNDAQVNKVKNIILDSNPALEAFGNAMTLRNNNSSRFGKYFEINFSASGTPMGGKITNFLLERGRLVNLSQGERSFHIFYQLVASNNQYKQNLYLSNNPNDYNLLRMSGVTQVNNEGGTRNDGQDFQETIDSLQTVNIFEKGQMNLFTICAAVLHISNIQFRDMKVGSADGSQLASQQAQQAVQNLAAVLQIDANALHQYLTYRTLVTMAPGKGVETLQVPQNAVQATATRDSIAKDLYARMFDLIVEKINESLKAGGAKTRTSVRMMMRQSQFNQMQHSLSIGVLDIYGFEIFEYNFFEQFCINYVNEKLQQVFIELTIRAEQEDYQSEGIAWKKIPFFDNKIVCELIEGTVAPSGGGPKKKKFGKGAKRSVGLFQILDDTAKTVTAMDPRVADKRFQEHTFGFHNGHSQLRQAANGFKIIHYAGEVNYTIDGFVDANRDTLSKDIRLLLKASSNRFVQALYPENVDYNDKTMPPSAGSKIKKQANVLIETLKQCDPHYVRCIKSNHRKAPKVFERDMVKHQVRYLNLLENVKIRRAGFAYRVKFLDFNKKFKVMGMGLLNEQFYARASPAEITTQLMQVAAQRIPQLMQQGEVQMGHTKLFIKTPEVLFELQKVRRYMLGEVATKIQRFYKFCKGQKRLFTMKMYMIELFERNGKPTSPVDVLGNYQAFYIDEPNTKNAIMEIINFYKEQAVVQEKVLYVDRVNRVGKTLDGTPEEVFLVITDVAFYILRYEQDMVLKKKKLKLFGKRKTNAKVKLDDMGNVQTRLVLKKRVPLDQIRELMFTSLADDMLKISCNVEQAQPENKEGWPDKKTVKRCMQSQEPFSFFGKSKNRCHFSGGIYIQELMSTATVPERGFYKPVPVLATLANKVKTEMQEDVIIESEHKGEICAMFMETITKMASRPAGNNPYGMASPFGGQQAAAQFDPRSCAMQPRFSNSWSVAGAEPLGFSFNGQMLCSMAPGIPYLAFTSNPDGSVTANIPSDGVSAERQQRLKAFLYKRQERKKAEIRAKQQMRQQARNNMMKYEQQDKELRARQRAERKARRAQGQAGAIGGGSSYQPPPLKTNTNPFAAAGGGGGGFGGANKFGPPGMGGSSRDIPQSPNKKLPPLPTRSTKNAGNTGSSNRFGGSKPANNFGGGSNRFGGGNTAAGSSNPFAASKRATETKPAFGGGSSNRFGGGNATAGSSNPFTASKRATETKPAFGGGSSNRFGAGNNKPAFGGGNNNKPAFGGNKPAFGGNKPAFGANKPAFGGEKKPAFGGNKPAFGGNKPAFGANKPAFGGEKKPAFGASKPAFGGNKPAFGANKPAFGGDKKPAFGANKPAFGGGDSKPAFGASKPAFGGAKPAFGGNKPAFGGGDSKPAFGGGSSNNFSKPSFGGGNKPAFGGGSKNFGGGGGSSNNFSKPAFGGGSKPAFGGGSKNFGGGGGSSNNFSKPSFGGGNKPAFGGSSKGSSKNYSPPPVPVAKSKYNDPDWERVYDPNTERHYFFNHRTQESEWDES